MENLEFSFLHAKWRPAGKEKQKPSFAPHLHLDLTANKSHGLPAYTHAWKCGYILIRVASGQPL